MQHWADYVIFVGFVSVSLGIGVYHAVTGGRQRTTEEFIMADRKLKLLPTILSMLMSYQSAILVIGAPSEVYTYGTQMWPMCIMGFWLAVIMSERICVPWLYPLHLTSVNKYFEMRYGDREIRAFASVVGIMNAILYMGVAMFAPAVALETATGFPMLASIPAMSIVCIIYTALGGMRAVIWTDVFQSVVMLGGMLAVLIRGMILVNGGGAALALVKQEGRMEWIDFNPDPRVRQTFWAYSIGWSTQWLSVFGLQQATVQRFSALPTMKKARISLLWNMPLLALLQSTAQLTGIAVFGYYAARQCDPILSGQIQHPNEILPLFVRDIFKSAYGFSGLFLSTLFSGALSSVSSNLSGSAANAWEDIISYHMVGTSQYKAAVINKILVAVFGLIACGISFLAAVMSGPIAQVALSFFGACGGPIMGMFMISGIPCFRFVRSRAVLLGGAIALAFNLWISIAAGFSKGKDPPMPYISIEGCETPLNGTSLFSSLNGTAIVSPLNGTTLAINEKEEIFPLYALSYMWYTPIGCIVTLIVGLFTSAIMNCVMPCERKKIEDRMFIPLGLMFSMKEASYKDISQEDIYQTEKEYELEISQKS